MAQLRMRLLLVPPGILLGTSKALTQYYKTVGLWSCRTSDQIPFILFREGGATINSSIL